MKNNAQWNYCWHVLWEHWGRQDANSGIKRYIVSVCASVCLEGARKEEIETCVWLEVRSEPLDECERVSLLVVCFVSAVLLFDALVSASHKRRFLLSLETEALAFLSLLRRIKILSPLPPSSPLSFLLCFAYLHFVSPCKPVYHWSV